MDYKDMESFKKIDMIVMKSYQFFALYVLVNDPYSQYIILR